MSKKSKKGKSSFFNYFKPSLTLKNFSELDAYLLKLNKIKLFICDLDNTLAPTFNALPSPAAINFAKQIKEAGIKFWVCSNNRKKRVSKFCEQIKPDGFVSFAMKPLKFKVKRIMKKANVSPEETIIMGDQFVIDVFVANRLGCKSLLVVPLAGQAKSGSTKFTNYLEKKVYNKLAQNNILVNVKSFESETKLL